MRCKKTILALLIPIIACACGRQTPEDRIVDAAEEVQEAKQEVSVANENVVAAKDNLEFLRKAVENAEAALATTKRDLRRLQRILAKSEANFDSTVSEHGIFRLVQTRLLDDPQLQESVIYANVTDDAVFLYGEVATEAEKQHAEELAMTTPGVSSVRNFIDIEIDQELPP